MGNTLYLGSAKSEIYFCIYEKDYEQYVKAGIPMEETKVKNRFEIRLKDDLVQSTQCLICWSTRTLGREGGTMLTSLLTVMFVF